jgi:hypothetical protein
MKKKFSFAVNLLVAFGIAASILFTPGAALSAQAAPSGPTGGTINALSGISISALPYSYSQNFDNPPTSMPTTGSATWTDNSTVSGWSAMRSGTGITIAASNGSSTAGNLYSFGTGTNSDRALGSLGSGNAAAGNFYWGVCFKNDYSTPIAISVGYTGEQWRYGGATGAQTADFSYSEWNGLYSFLRTQLYRPYHQWCYGTIGWQPFCQSRRIQFYRYLGSSPGRAVYHLALV